MYCDNCGASEVNLEIIKVVDGEHHCKYCTPTLDIELITEMQRQVKDDLDYDDVIRIEDALALFHEVLPGYYDLCRMNKLQHTANSRRPIMEL